MGSDRIVPLCGIVAILVVSAVITRLFARAMYLTCPKCRALNARRRSHCRNCGEELRKMKNLN